MFDQINTETNRYNGTLNTALDIISAETSSFGEIQTVTRELSCFKLFRHGMINEIKVSIVNEYGKTIDNNCQPITAVLQIINMSIYEKATAVTLDVDAYAKTTFVDTTVESGETMTGVVVMESNKITGVADPTTASDAATKAMSIL